MYRSIQHSCKKYSWELVMCGPFELTDFLKEQTNVKMIIDCGSPSRCAQIAALNAKGKLIAHTVDDALFFDDSLDEAISFYNQTCTKKDAVNLRYREGVNYRGDVMPDGYWTVEHHPGLHLPGVPMEYEWACHHLIDLEYFKEIGGYDCSYEYQNYNLHDLMFRVQYNGGVLYHSPVEATTCAHFPGRAVDHGAIMDAHETNDLPLFQHMYGDPEVLKTRYKIDLDNWKRTEPVWQRRFSRGKPKDYEEILRNNEV